MQLFFAPLQGYTDAAYRRIHHEVIGGIDEYYTPFIRWEKDGLRRKDLRDIDPQRCMDVPTVPQVIANGRDEFAHLCDAVQALGWRRIDLNMGCPFPMQSRAGRGSGILPHPDRVREIADEMLCRPEVCFSVKMRLGQEHPDEIRTLLPILDAMPLTHVTLHPRIGLQQYKGVPDLEAFARVYEQLHHPLIYNGDIRSRSQAECILRQYPRLKGLMLGRGLLSTPWMMQDTEHCHGEKLMEMHRRYYQHAITTYQGDAQILSHLQSFWEYPSIHLDRKTYKQIKKARTLNEYGPVVRNLEIQLA